MRRKEIIKEKVEINKIESKRDRESQNQKLAF